MTGALQALAVGPSSFKSREFISLTPMQSDSSLVNRHEAPAQFRIIVVPLVENDRGEYLICKMPSHRGVFPDKWGLPGGGIDEGERMKDALRREVREELGIEITDIKPLFFKDGQYVKRFADGREKEIYMIFLIFSCKAVNTELILNPEFTDYAWVAKSLLSSYDLNSVTMETFIEAGVLNDVTKS